MIQGCERTSTGLKKVWFFSASKIASITLDREGVVRQLALVAGARVVEYRFEPAEAELRNQFDAGRNTWTNSIRFTNRTVAKELLRAWYGESPLEGRLCAVLFLNNGQRMLFGIDAYPDRGFEWEYRPVYASTRDLVNEGVASGNRGVESGFSHESDHPTFYLSADLSALTVTVPPPAIPLEDVVAPVARQYFPADNALNVALNAQPWVRFSEPVVFGIGSFRLYDSGGLVHTWTVTDPADVAYDAATNKVSLIGHPVFDPLENYYILADITVIEDVAGNNWAGIASATVWNWTTQAAPDVTPPTAIAFDPLDNSVAVPLNKVATITFNENIQKGAGTITLTRTDLTLAVATLDIVSSSRVTVSGDEVSIDLNGLLNGDTPYAITITAGGFRDLAGNAWAGVSGFTTWNFVTAETVPPVATTFFPADGAASADRNVVWYIDFDENISIGTGTIEYYENSVLIRTLTPSDTANVYVTGGNRLNIDLEQWSNHGVAGEIRISNTFISDASGNLWGGLAAGDWNFTVGYPESRLSVTHSTQTGFTVGLQVTARMLAQLDLYYHLVIDWGDGTYTNLGTGGTTYTVYSKTYAAAGTYTVRIRFPRRKAGAATNPGLGNLQQVFFNGQRYSAATIESHTAINLYVIQNGTTNPVAVTVGTNLAMENVFNINAVAATGALNFTGAVMANFSFQGSAFTSLNFTGVTMARNVNSISLNGNTVIGYVNLTPFIPFLKQGSPTADLRNMGLSQANVNSYLADFDANLPAVGPGQPSVLIRLATTNAAPGAAGLVSKANLIGKGHTVETN